MIGHTVQQLEAMTKTQLLAVAGPMGITKTKRYLGGNTTRKSKFDLVKEIAEIRLGPARPPRVRHTVASLRGLMRTQGLRLSRTSTIGGVRKSRAYNKGDMMRQLGLNGQAVQAPVGIPVQVRITSTGVVRNRVTRDYLKEFIHPGRTRIATLREYEATFRSIQGGGVRLTQDMAVAITEERYVDVINSAESMPDLFRIIHSLGDSLQQDHRASTVAISNTIGGFLRQAPSHQILIQIKSSIPGGAGVREHFYTFTESNVYNLARSIMGTRPGFFLDDEERPESDPDIDADIERLDSVVEFDQGEFAEYVAEDAGGYFEADFNDADYNDQTGNFFAYVNKSPFDLSMCQIYNEKQLKECATFGPNVDAPVNRALRTHCVRFAIELNLYMLSKGHGLGRISKPLEAGALENASRIMGEGIVDQIEFNSTSSKISNMLNHSFNKNKLQQLVNTIGYSIRLAFWSPSQGRTEYTVYKPKKGFAHPRPDLMLELALYKSHYFYNPKINFSAVSLKYLDELVKQGIPQKRWPQVQALRPSGKFKFTKRAPKKALITVVRSLFDLGYFEAYSDTSVASEKSSVFNTELFDVQTEPVKPSRPKPEYDFIFVADFETAPEAESHIPFIVSIKPIKGPNGVSLKYPPVSFYGPDCGRSMLKWMPPSKVKTGEEHVEGPDGLEVVKPVYRQQRLAIYFHNLRYDMNFLSKYMGFDDTSITQGNTVYSLTGHFFGKKITLLDSVKIIPKPLKEFNGMFNLGSTVKEIMPYSAYTSETIKDTSMTVGFALSHLPERKHAGFIENLKTVQKTIYSRVVTATGVKRVAKKYPILYNDNEDVLKRTFDHIAYAKYYCDIDVEILAQGLAKMNDIIGRISAEKGGDGTARLSVFNNLTIPSISHQVFKINGAYDGVHRTCGLFNSWMQQSIFGGVVNVKLDDGHKTMYDIHSSVVDGKLCDTIEDFDAVSLYPSAIERLCREYGFPLGAPEAIPEHIIGDGDGDAFMENVGRLAETSKVARPAYWVEILIHGTRRTLANPVISIRDAVTGIMNYTNEIVEEKKVVNMLTLEDWVRYQDIKFTVVKGYYYPLGFNKTGGRLIREMFQERLRQGKTPMNGVIKLLMNAVYGKTITKYRGQRNIFVSPRKIARYVSKHQNNILRIAKYHQTWVVTEWAAISKHSNINSVGSLILSMSKRMFNEVSHDCCELYETRDSVGEAGRHINVFYQDTDSMHVYSKDLDELKRRFMELFGRELVGKDMGQFHSDFTAPDLPYDEVMETGVVGGAGTSKDSIVSTRCIILGKKVYVDHLLNLRTKKTGIHIRMKGVGSKAVLRKAREFLKEANEDVDYEPTREEVNAQVLEIYEQLAKGVKITFNLVSDETVKFAYDGYGNVRSLSEFLRKIHFDSLLKQL